MGETHPALTLVLALAVGILAQEGITANVHFVGLDSNTTDCNAVW